jgi:hypothetical protein
VQAEDLTELNVGQVVWFLFIGLMTYDQSVAAGVVDLDRIGPVRVVDGMITGWHDAGVLFGRALDFSKSELPSG